MPAEQTQVELMILEILREKPDQTWNGVNNLLLHKLVIPTLNKLVEDGVLIAAGQYNDARYRISPKVEW